MHVQVVFITLAIGFLTTACVAPSPNNPVPAPSATCPATPSWHGIKPGHSTRREVVEALGNPPRRDSERFGNHSIPFYAYAVKDGVIAGLVEDRIFFGPDGVVDWMEIVVADRDGQFHSVRETVARQGSILDTVYMNNNYRPGSGQPDIHAGPDQLYVWSECGLVLDALPGCSPSQLGGLKCVSGENLMRSTASPSASMTLRRASPYHLAEGPFLDVDGIVLMEIMFRPISYAGFEDAYMYKIPFGLWDTYIARMRSVR